MMTSEMQYVVWVVEHAGKSLRGSRALSAAALTADLPTGAARETTRRAASQARVGTERRFISPQR
jgi:hypothetical protein